MSPISTADLPLWFIRVFALSWGAIWGSFANVVIYRWPRELSLSHPPSRCPHCETPIRFYDNVPVLGWLWLGGKCRACRAPISPRYPFVEALYGVAAFVVAERIVRMETAPALSLGLATFFARFAFAWGLLTVAFIDMETFLIPDFLSIGGAVLGIAVSFVIPGVGWQSSVEGAVLGFSLLYALHFIWSRFLKREGMGLGDAKLLAAIGAFQGPGGVLFALFAGSIQGLVATLISRVTGWQLGPDPSLLDDDDEDEEPAKTDAALTPEGSVESDGSAKADEATREDPGLMRTVIPFGPFLVLGALEYLLGMDALVRDLFERLTAP